MKLKDGIIITKAGDDYVAVDAGTHGQRFNGMLKLNETAAFIVQQLQKETSLESIIDALCGQYSIDRVTAADHIQAVLQQLASVSLIEND